MARPRDEWDALPFLTDDAVTNIYAAMVRQALTDYRNDYHCHKHPEAAAFLAAIGIVQPDGSLFAFGHVMPPPKAKRQPSTPQRHGENDTGGHVQKGVPVK